MAGSCWLVLSCVFLHVRGLTIHKKAEDGSSMQEPQHQVQKFVIIAQPRSGARWVADLLKSHGEIVSAGEELSGWQEVQNCAIRKLDPEGGLEEAEPTMNELTQSFNEFFEGTHPSFKHMDGKFPACYLNRTATWKWDVEDGPSAVGFAWIPDAQGARDEERLQAVGRFLVDKDVKIIMVRRANFLNYYHSTVIHREARRNNRSFGDDARVIEQIEYLKGLKIQERDRLRRRLDAIESEMNASQQERDRLLSRLDEIEEDLAEGHLLVSRTNRTGLLQTAGLLPLANAPKNPSQGLIWSPLTNATEYTLPKEKPTENTKTAQKEHAIVKPVHANTKPLHVNPNKSRALFRGDVPTAEGEPEFIGVNAPTAEGQHEATSGDVFTSAGQHVVKIADLNRTARHFTRIHEMFSNFNATFNEAGQHVLEVTYEELLEKKEDVAQRLQTFLGLESLPLQSAFAEKIRTECPECYIANWPEVEMALKELFPSEGSGVR